MCSLVFPLEGLKDIQVQTYGKSWDQNPREREHYAENRLFRSVPHDGQSLKAIAKPATQPMDGSPASACFTRAIGVCLLIVMADIGRPRRHGVARVPSLRLYSAEGSPFPARACVHVKLACLPAPSPRARSRTGRRQSCWAVAFLRTVRLFFLALSVVKEGREFQMKSVCAKPQGS